MEQNTNDMSMLSFILDVVVNFGQIFIYCMFSNNHDNIFLSCNNILDGHICTGFETTPDCTGSSTIDDSMFDSGVYTIIGSKCHCIIQHQRIYHLFASDFFQLIF
jgi:hypothetical protein